MSKRKNKRVVCPEPSKADINRVMEAAGLLRDSLVDEQAEEIERLKSALAGVTKERDWFEQCLKSAESALVYKDKVISKIKKNNAKRVARLREDVDVLEEEVAFQYKRANKADAFIKQIDGACDLIKKHIAAYGK
nr:MAG TPA: hypothetical protein [Caudoviricetes sp.]